MKQTGMLFKGQRNRESKEVHLLVVRYQIPLNSFLEAFFSFCSISPLQCVEGIILIYCAVKVDKGDTEATS